MKLSPDFFFHLLTIPAVMWSVSQYILFFFIMIFLQNANGIYLHANDGPMYEIQSLDKLVPPGYRMISVPDLRDRLNGIGAKAFPVNENEICEVQTVSKPFKVLYRIRGPGDTPKEWNSMHPSSLHIDASNGIVEPIICLRNFDMTSSKKEHIVIIVLLIVIVICGISIALHMTGEGQNNARNFVFGKFFIFY